MVFQYNKTILDIYYILLYVYIYIDIDIRMIINCNILETCFLSRRAVPVVAEEQS